MTIQQMERKIAELEARIAALESHPAVAVPPLHLEYVLQPNTSVLPSTPVVTEINT